MSEAIQLDVRTNKQTFPASGSNQLVYLLIEAMPTGAVASVQMPLNFSLVLDRSGSMSGAKLKNLKAAANLALEQMSAQDLISVVVFDDKYDVIVESQPVTDLNALQQRIERIRAGGGTKMSLGMKRGLEQLQQGMRADRISRMLLLTDGETFGDEADCRHYGQKAGQHSCAITALGLGDEWNDVLLDEIAQSSGGSSDWIPDGQPEAILKVFRQQVRVAQATVIQNAMMLLRLVPGAVPRAVWRVTPMIEKLGHRALSDRDVQISLGDMDRQQGQSVLIELLVGPREPGTYRIAQAEINYDVAALQLSGEKVKSDILLGFSADPSQTIQSDPYVLNIVEKVTAHKLQTRALDEAAAGNIAGATQKLRAAATRLLELGEDNLAQTALSEAERLEKGQGLSEGGTKKLRYETRKLTQKLDD